MNLVTSIWENAYGLLVDDGWIASGTLLALLAIAAWSALAGENHALRDVGGPLLFVLLMSLLLVNLYVTGQKAARRHISHE